MKKMYENECASKNLETRKRAIKTAYENLI